MKLRSDIPREIERPCCPGKSCGMVTLYLAVDARLHGEEIVELCGYIRDNNDWYFGPYETVDELVAALEDSA